MSKQTLLEFQEQLKKSRRIVALVGAGLSVLSGLPTFRGAEGMWKNFNMIDLATPDAFYIDPGLVWQFYSWRRYSALASKPNRGHIALSKLSNLPQINFITITQNVDGLLARSGHCKDNLYDIHGSLFTLKCTNFMCNYIEHDNFKSPLTPALRGTENEFVLGSAADTTKSPQFTPVKQLEDSELPQCPVCKSSGRQSILRPGVVWFGELLPLQDLNEIDDFLESDEGNVDLILVIGTSGTVYPANSYVDRVRLQGGKVAIFNTDIDETAIEGKEGIWGFKGDAAELLPIALEPLIGEVETD